MSQGVKTAIGFLLCMISGVILFMVSADNVEESRQLTAYMFIFIEMPAVLGVCLMLSGLFWQVDDRFKHVITKKATPKYLFMGMALVTVSIGILLLFYHVWHLMPHFLLIGALLGIPIGVVIMGNLYSEACSRCQRELSTSYKLWNEIPFRQIVPSHVSFKDNTMLNFSFCPSCNHFVRIETSKKNACLVEGEHAVAIHQCLATDRHRDQG